MFSGGVSVMWVTSKLCNVRAYSQYTFGLPWLNSRVIEFVNMVPVVTLSLFLLVIFQPNAEGFNFFRLEECF